jgi:hypothetical protein
MGYIPKMLLPPTLSAADLLRTYKLPALRRFAQNFLLDPRATSKFVACTGNIENSMQIEREVIYGYREINFYFYSMRI